MEDSSNTSSLLFNETYSAFDYVAPSENQTRFYDTFLLNTTDPNRRILKFTGYLQSQDLIDRLKLNNTIYINNEEFTINKYDVQLNTGKVELEVIYVSNDDVGMQQVINQAKLNIND
jgi:hypothetical protein